MQSISKNPADRVLPQLLVSEAKKGERQQMAKAITRQAKSFAEILKLPEPVLQTVRRENLLAAKLTEIETKNYAAVTGEKIGTRTFEVLAEKSLLLAELPVSAECQREIVETFKHLPVAPRFTSAQENAMVLSM